jgi:hypothetical protein
MVKKEDCIVNMPLILTENRQFSLIHFKPNTLFKMGKLVRHCDMELIYESSKLEDTEFKSIKSYVGSVYDGVFHGQGELKYTNGDVYKGILSSVERMGRVSTRMWKQMMSTIQNGWMICSMENVVFYLE